MDTQRIIKQELKHIIQLLVSKSYVEIETYTNNIRMTAGEIKECIDDYGGNVISPPDSAFEHIDIIEISDLPHKEWSVRFSLWIDEEGKSDLSLDMFISVGAGENIRVELYNIVVF